MYSRVEDIDLFVGLSLEEPDPEAGAPVGLTFMCLIGDQFAKLKKGDRCVVVCMLLAIDHLRNFAIAI